MSEHIKLTSSDFYNTEELIPEAVLDANDPIQDMRALAGISNNNVGKLQEYKGYGSVSTEGSSGSRAAVDKIQYQHNNNVQPGSPEWFKLWFTRSDITGTSPFN